MQNGPGSARVKQLRGVILAGLVWLAGSFAAQGQTLQDVDKTIAAEAMQWMDAVFAVAPEATIDAPLRAAAEDLARAHKARLPALIDAWLAQERAAGGPELKPDALRRQLLSRLTNELALWRLREGGKSFEDAWLAALAQPRLCQGQGGHTYYTDLVLLWQGVPEAHRPALLAAERRLLEGWAVDPPQPPPRPALDLRDTLRRAMADAPGAAAPPMPPIVAMNLLRRGADDEQLHRAVRCAGFQWALQQTLAADGTPPAQAWLAWRYAMLPTADFWFSQPERDAKGGDYPPVAQRLSVEGAVTVELTARDSADAAAPFARIASRNITVPGVRGVRPVAFETLLDAASLKRAATARIPADSRGRRRVEYLWRLE
jgi:hypothetical protein